MLRIYSVGSRYDVVSPGLTPGFAVFTQLTHRRDEVATQPQWRPAVR